VTHLRETEMQNAEKHHNAQQRQSNASIKRKTKGAMAAKSATKTPFGCHSDSKRGASAIRSTYTPVATSHGMLDWVSSARPVRRMICSDIPRPDVGSPR